MRALDGVVGGRTAFWLVPLAVVGLVAAGAAAVSVGTPASVAADGHPRLPARSAAQLWNEVVTHTATPLAGTVVETARLGLEPLSGLAGWPMVLVGSHTVRVWSGGISLSRLAFLGRLSETDVIRDRTTLWTYHSGTDAVVRTVLSGPGAADAVETVTPQAAAARLAEALDPGAGGTTAALVGRPQQVAGRAAYTLLLRPRGPGSTLREVSLAVDGLTGIPLRVQVFGAGPAPVWQTGFTDVDVRRPAASLFAFRPPGGAAVTVDEPVRSGTPAASVIGAGWTAVLRIHGAAVTGTGIPLGASGDHLIAAGAVSVVRTRTGDLFLGAVPAVTVERVAAANR